MASRLFWWMDLVRCRKKSSSSEKTGVGKMSRRSGVELCECCRVRMKAWLAWLEERLVEWCASTPELDPAYLDLLQRIAGLGGAFLFVNKDREVNIV